MNIYDVTLSIDQNLITWPGDPSVKLNLMSSKEKGDDFNVSHISMSVHTGTHVDAPRHIIDNGVTIDQLSIRLMFGRVYVLGLEDVDCITEDILRHAEIPPKTQRILFKTKNSKYWENGNNTFHENYVAIRRDAAEYLIRKGIKLIGVDYLSVAPFTDAVAVHKILLSAGIVIIEGLDLHHVNPGRYNLYCMPLKIKGCDGAPARVVLTGV